MSGTGGKARSGEATAISKPNRGLFVLAVSFVVSGLP